MTLSQFVSPPIPADKDFQKKSDEIVMWFSNSIRQRFSPVLTRKTLLEKIDDFSNIWSKSLDSYNGHRPKSVYIDRYKNVRYLSVVNKVMHKHFWYRDSERLKFDRRDWMKMISVQAAFHYSKFGTIKMHELKLAALFILVNRFNTFEYAYGSLSDFVWNIDVMDVLEVLDGIYNYDDSDFTDYVRTYINIDQNDLLPKETKERCMEIKIQKPVCADDLLKYYEDGMSVEDFVERLQDLWRLSRRSVFNYFKRFGINTKSMTKANNQEWEIQRLRSLLVSKDREIEELKRSYEKKIADMQAEFNSIFESEIK